MRSSSKTVLKQPSYIADGDKYHQQYQQCKTDKMYAALNLRIKVLASQHCKQQKQRPTAVECGQRQQIDNTDSSDLPSLFAPLYRFAR